MHDHICMIQKAKNKEQCYVLTNQDENEHHHIEDHKKRRPPSPLHCLLPVGMFPHKNKEQQRFGYGAPFSYRNFFLLCANLVIAKQITLSGTKHWTVRLFR